MSDESKPTGARSRWLAWLGWGVGWALTLAAGGGGVRLLLTKDPTRLTNGWFAVGVGMAACPLLYWALERYLRLRVPVVARVILVALIWAAGRWALWAGL